jgi:hypothetical protein
MAIKLARTPSSAGNQKTFTFSTWYKRSYLALGSGGTSGLLTAYYGNSSRYTQFVIDLDDNLELFSGVYTTTAPASYNMDIVTKMKFRDVNSWYHIVVAVDTTQATDTDRVKVWVNGVLQEVEGNYGSIIYPTQNSDTFVNSTIASHYLCSNGQDNRGYMAHTHFIDGTAYDADTFGESDANGVWKAKTSPSVTYGTNGFFMKYENSSNFGTDSSVNGNTLSVTGTPTQTLDTPSNVYCTMNPLENFFTGSTFANGNTSVTTGSSSSTYNMSTMAMSAGKWYWEMKMTSASPLGNLNFGIVNAPTEDSAQRLRGASTTNSVAATDYNYAIYANGVSTGINGEIVAQNDIVMFAFDADNNGLYIGKNGSWYNSGDPTSGASKTGAFTPGTAGLDYFPAIGDENGSAGYSVQFNFGNGYFGTTAVSSAGSNGNGSIFEYDVPTGYYALNTKNLATYG